MILQVGGVGFSRSVLRLSKLGILADLGEGDYSTPPLKDIGKMGLLQFLYAAVMFVLLSVLLVAIIGAVTVAVTIGGGPLMGLLVLALLIGNAWVWGGWGKK